MNSKTFKTTVEFTIKVGDLKEAFMGDITCSCAPLYAENKALCDKFIKTIDFVKILNSKKFIDHVKMYMRDCEYYDYYEYDCCSGFFEVHYLDVVEPIVVKLTDYVNKNKKPVKTISEEYHINFVGTVEQLKNTLAAIEEFTTIQKITKI
jgi:hypothetical protein